MALVSVNNQSAHNELVASSGNGQVAVQQVVVLVNSIMIPCHSSVVFLTLFSIGSGKDVESHGTHHVTGTYYHKY